MKIGLIVAIETDAVFGYYGTVEQLEGPAGFDVYRICSGEQEIYAVHTGMGEIAAAAGVQYLITRFGVELIVNFGVVGGLSEALKVRRVCVVDRVVHYKYDCSEFLPLAVGQVDGHDSVYLLPDPALVGKALEVLPELRRATCCSGDKFVGTETEKRELASRFEGDVCDMESAGVVLTCEANGVPCLLLKAVSDGLAGGAGEFFDLLKTAAMDCMEAADRVMEAL